jgi:NADH-quinone oxidoreductase subunit K
VIHVAGPYLLAAVLAGLGTYGMLARRNAILVLVGAELLLNAVNVVLVAVDAAIADPLLGGQVLTLFVVTIAAAEIGVALAVVLLLFRRTRSSDVREARSLGEAARPGKAREAR